MSINLYDGANNKVGEIPDDPSQEPTYYNDIDHPQHYCQDGIECIDEMIMLYGINEVKSFCKLNAHKYRKRAMLKGGKKDIEKSNWYIKMYAYLDAKQNSNVGQAIVKKYELNDFGLRI